MRIARSRSSAEIGSTGAMPSESASFDVDREHARALQAGPHALGDERVGLEQRETDAGGTRIDRTAQAHSRPEAGDGDDSHT